jgi:hypothetical protein
MEISGDYPAPIDLPAATIRQGSATLKIRSVYAVKITVRTSARDLTPVVCLVYGRCIC